MNKKKALVTSLAALTLVATANTSFAEEVDAIVAEPVVTEVPATEVAQESSVADDVVEVPDEEASQETAVAEIVAEETVLEESVVATRAIEEEVQPTTVAAASAGEAEARYEALVADLNKFAQGETAGFNDELAKVEEDSLISSYPTFISSDQTAMFTYQPGTFIPDRDLQVYSYPNVDTTPVATYSAGEAINFDLKGFHPGNTLWISYTSDSGVRRFVKYGNAMSAAILPNGEKEPFFGEFVTAEEVPAEDANPYAELIAKLESGGEEAYAILPGLRGAQEVNYVISDIDLNNTPELVVTASSDVIKAVFALINGKTDLIVSSAHHGGNDPIFIADNGDIIQQYWERLDVYEKVYRIRTDNSGVDVVAENSFSRGDSANSLLGGYTLVDATKLTPWTPTTENRSETTGSDITVTQTAQPTLGDVVHVPLTAKTETAVTPVKQATPAKQSYSRTEKAQAEKTAKSEKGILPSTGEAVSMLGLVGAGLSALGLAGLRRRQK